LQRLVSVVKLVAEEGLAFGNDEKRWIAQKVFRKYFQNFFSNKY